MVAATKTKTRITTPTDREVVITRVVDAPRRLVFEAYTNPQYIPRWMLGPGGWTMPVCEVDLRPGGRYRYVWRKPEGSEMTIAGSIREVSPPARMVTTESWGPEWPETVNTLELTESNGQTTITTTMLFPSKEARDTALKTGMSDGMETSFGNLEKLLKEMA